jgi:hypothetical protein
VRYPTALGDHGGDGVELWGADHSAAARLRAEDGALRCGDAPGQLSAGPSRGVSGLSVSHSESGFLRRFCAGAQGASQPKTAVSGPARAVAIKDTHSLVRWALPLAATAATRCSYGGMRRSRTALRTAAPSPASPARPCSSSGSAGRGLRCRSASHTSHGRHCHFGRK